MAAFLPIESFAAGDPSDTKSHKRDYYTKLMKPENNSVMKTLLKQNSERRKAFNRYDDTDTTASTEAINTVLKNKGRVAVDRYATDTEKDDILRILIATAITSPSSPPTYMTTDLDAAKTSPHPLDRHSYIVDMAEIFARKLMNREEIESDFSTFQTFSGVDKDRFLKLFDQVKRNHRRGLEAPQAEPDLASLDNSARGNISPNNYKAIRTLGVIASKNTLIATKAFEELMNITYDYALDLPLRNKALWTLGKVAKKAPRLTIAEPALLVLLDTANEDSHPLQKGAILNLGHVVIDGTHKEIREKALNAVLELAKDTAHQQRDIAFLALQNVAIKGNDDNISKAAVNAFLEIAQDKGDPQQSYAFGTLSCIARNGNDESARKFAFEAMLRVAKDNDYKDFLNMLSDMVSDSNHENTRDAARRTLTAISGDARKSEEVRKVAKRALERESILAGIDGPVEMTLNLA